MRTLRFWSLFAAAKKAFKKGHLFVQLLTFCKITLVSKRFGINLFWPQLESLIDLIIAHSKEGLQKIQKYFKS